MKKMPIQELTPGLVLGRTVVSREGVALLEKGGRLTQTAIAILLRRDVPFVYIEEQS
jgi:hypothetical protein